MPVTILDPHLRAGWEPDTPESDFILRRFLINWTASIEAHGIPLGGRSLRRDDLAAVDVARPAGGENTATLLAPLFADGVDEVMSALDDFYGFTTGATSGTVYLFSPWPTPDLRPYGWNLSDYPLLMLRPSGGTLPAPPEGLRIEEVRDQQALEACEVAIVRDFPLPEVEARGPERHSARTSSPTNACNCGSVGMKASRSARPWPSSPRGSSTSHSWRRRRKRGGVALARR